MTLPLILLGQEVHLVKLNDVSLLASSVVNTVLLVVTAVGGGGYDTQSAGVVKTSSPLVLDVVLMTERARFDPHTRYSVKGAEPLLMNMSAAAL